MSGQRRRRRLTAAMHELIEWEVAAAYAHGYRAALLDIAEGRAELDAAWRPIAHATYERRVAERLTEMEHCARRLRAELDRHAGRPRTDDWPPVAVPGHPATAA